MTTFCSRHLAVAALPCACIFVVALVVRGESGVSSKLLIHLPTELAKPGGYDHREALFGVPPYGGSIQQSVYYAGTDLCSPNVDTHAGYPTRPKDKSGKMTAWPSPYILMVDRGNCTFVQKVRNAQRSGAAAVIIADDTCLCARTDCVSEKGAQCENNEPIMADDGSGRDISIPSFLMFKEDADPVKAVMKDKNKPVRMELAWALPSPDDHVEYQLWTTPTDLVSSDFQRQFGEAAIAFGSRAFFTPHMYVYDGIASGCQGTDGENQCFNLCTNNGRYCSTDPDNDLDRGVSGADVVKESLRRVCIWATYGEADGIGKVWWDYINEFMSSCDTEEFFANEDCAKDAMTHAKADNLKIDKCMFDSGGLTNDTQNTLLEGQLRAKDATGVVILPAAYVNGAAIRGALEFSTIFKAICAGFLHGTSPGICGECAFCQDVYACVKRGYCSSAHAEGAVSTKAFFASVVGLAICFGVLGFIQYKRSQRQVRDQVRGILAEYMPLDENGKVFDTSVALDEDGEFT